MSDAPDLLVLAFVSKQSSDSFENNLRVALEDCGRSHHLAIFDVAQLPELTDTYSIVVTPTLVLDDLSSGRSARLIGQATLAEIAEFLASGRDEMRERRLRKRNDKFGRSS